MTDSTMSNARHPRKFLIVGGNGFVGRNLTNMIIEQEQDTDEIYVMDNLLSSDVNQVIDNKKVIFLEKDAGITTSFNDLPSDINNVFILNCLHGNQSSLHNPILDLGHSLQPVVATLEWVRRKNKQAKIVYAGAGCAVAEKTWSDPSPVSETDLVSLDHDSPYSISKLAGEMHCKMYSKQFGLDVRRARFQNVYGPGEKLGAGVWRGTSATIWRNVIPTFIWKALNDEDLIVTGESASRDFIFVKDLVQGLLSILDKGRLGEAYNLATGHESKIAEVAHVIVELSGSKSKVVINPAREWDNSGRRFASTHKSLTELEFSAGVDLEVGLDKTITWTIENKIEIQEAIAKHAIHL
jgi:nucleoside-diphosphate-sugar epimerase